ncbi:hypothetical protein Bbelb_152730 [Branchiostoma belcheri]|nr:hypothetical protein Bbelb_152730 [Branchiostoma belcheri]
MQGYSTTQGFGSTPVRTPENTCLFHSPGRHGNVTHLADVCEGFLKKVLSWKQRDGMKESAEECQPLKEKSRAWSICGEWVKAFDKSPCLALSKGVLLPVGHMATPPAVVFVPSRSSAVKTFLGPQQVIFMDDISTRIDFRQI